MIHEQNLERLKNKLKDQGPKFKINIKSFQKFYSHFEREDRILLCGDTGTNKTGFTLKYFILELINQVKENPLLDCKIYYFSLEANALLIYSRLYHMLIYEHFGVKIAIDELRSPTEQSTIDYIEKLSDIMKRIESKLVIIDNIHAPSEMFKYVKKDLNNYGVPFQKEDKSWSFKFTNDNFYPFVIVDTINAAIPEKGLQAYGSIKAWSAEYAKVYLSQGYGCIIVNVQQFDNSIRVAQFSNTGMRVDEKHEPSLGKLQDVKTTPTDHTLVLSLWQPARYGINKHRDLPVHLLKESYIRLNIMKANLHQSGPDATSDLYFEETIACEELPEASDTNAVMKFLKDKGIEKKTFAQININN